MIVHAEDVVQFRSTTHPEHHLAVKGNSIVGDVSRLLILHVCVCDT